MKTKYLRLALTLGLVTAVASIASAQNIYVQTDLTTSLSDVYAFVATMPGGTTFAAADSLGTLSTGYTQSVVPNANEFGGSTYEVILMGEYTDPSGVTHVALGTASDLTGDAWTTLFPQSYLAENLVAADLAAGATGASNSLASDILSYYIPNVDPMTGYSGAGFVTSFSGGVNIGTIATSATPEPSPFLALGLAPLVLLRRRRRS